MPVEPKRKIEIGANLADTIQWVVVLVFILLVIRSCR
jgi:hypothetical protein